jgi:transposase, IS30 family
MAVGDGRPRIARRVAREFWRQVRAGLAPSDAAAAVGVSRGLGERWVRDGGGMPRVSLAEPSGRYLSHQDREEIAVGIAAGETDAQIARRLGRPRSTISRELVRNCPRFSDGRLYGRRYRAHSAQRKAEARAGRPKTAKLVAHPPLRDYVQAKLEGTQHWSPEQIAARLPIEFPHDERMRICHETIYQSIYGQGRGALRRELASCLRTGRVLRKPRCSSAERRGRIKDTVMISERPAEVADQPCPVTGRAT